MSANEKDSPKPNGDVHLKSSFLNRLKEDGVVNPKGLSLIGGGSFPLLMIPLTSLIARRNGVLDILVNALCKSVVFVGSAGSVTQVSQTGKIAALSCFYLTVAYGFTSANAAAGSESGNVEARDNQSPRLQNLKLNGLPLRLQSAHQHMLEIFPMFAIGAALSQVMAPGDQGVINLLGLHVITRVFFHYPIYLLNYGGPRTVAHIFGTACIINVAVKLSML